MRHYEWSEGKFLTDNLLEMGFLDGQTTFRKRAAMADYLDAYFERKRREEEESKRNVADMMVHR